MSWKGAIEQEKSTVKKMITLYCKGKHGFKQDLCPDCRDLLEYALKRLNRCKFGSEKTTCEKCPVHCYKPDMRERVKIVMRYAGPRMIFVHPVAAVRHMLKNKKSGHKD